MAELNSKDKAPQFQLQDQNGNQVKLSNFKGKKLLVYFYPKADTPGCTKQACTVRDATADLTSTGIQVVGISPDSPAKQKKFDEKYGLGFPLLSDADHAVAEAYGAWGEKKMYGKTYMGIVRSSFLINEKGLIEKSWYNVSPTATVSNVQESLSSGGTQVAKKADETKKVEKKVEEKPAAKKAPAKKIEKPAAEPKKTEVKKTPAKKIDPPKVAQKEETKKAPAKKTEAKKVAAKPAAVKGPEKKAEKKTETKKTDPKKAAPKTEAKKPESKATVTKKVTPKKPAAKKA